MNRVTPEQLEAEDIKNYDIFVFGSNESGVHGAGAARFAHQYLGACMGQGFGDSYKSFAIPTKDWRLGPLDLEVIEFYVKRFIAFVESTDTGTFPEIRFLVTKIGCGLAGFTPEQIAPFFKRLRNNPIVWLPQEFIDVIDKITEKEPLLN